MNILTIAFYIFLYLISSMIFISFRFGNHKLQLKYANAIDKLFNKGESGFSVLKAILFSAGLEVVIFSAIYFGIILIYETYK